MSADPNRSTLTAKVHQVAALAREAAGTDDPTILENLETELGGLRAVARERMQERFRSAYLDLAAKLETNQWLDERDKRILAVIATGAADDYLRNENDLDAWRSEIRRLADLLEDLPDDAEDGTGSGLRRYLHVQATVGEAMRVVPDLRFFLQEAERLKRFEAASRSMDPDDRKFLARIIRDQLASPDR